MVNCIEHLFICIFASLCISSWKNLFNFFHFKLIYYLGGWSLKGCSRRTTGGLSSQFTELCVSMWRLRLVMTGVLRSQIFPKTTLRVFRGFYSCICNFPALLGQHLNILRGIYRNRLSKKKKKKNRLAACKACNLPIYRWYYWLCALAWLLAVLSGYIPTCKLFWKYLPHMWLKKTLFTQKIILGMTIALHVLNLGLSLCIPSGHPSLGWERSIQREKWTLRISKCDPKSNSK